MDSVEQDQDIAVEIAKDFKDIDVCLSKLKQLVKAVCKRFKLSKATVSIAIVDDAEIRRVNKQFLNRKSTTDCLSFDLSDDDTEGKKTSHEGRVTRDGLSIYRPSSIVHREFELVVNGEMAVKEANLRGHSSEAELALYITHGLLHNLGFNDATQSQAKKMHDTEDEILQQLGYGLVYNK